jgi:hypothetical protein
MGCKAAMDADEYLESIEDAETVATGAADDD